MTSLRLVQYTTQNGYLIWIRSIVIAHIHARRVPLKGPSANHKGTEEEGSPIRWPRSPGLHTAAALLSPFLVPRLQLLGSVPQEDVVLFLGVVVLVALGNSDKSTILQNMSGGQMWRACRQFSITVIKHKHLLTPFVQILHLLPLTSRNWTHMQRCCHFGWSNKPWWAGQAALRSSTWCGRLCPRSWSVRLSPQ